MKFKIQSSLLKTRDICSIAVFLALAVRVSSAEPVNGWLAWDGPNQNGVSAETNLPDKCEPGGATELWSRDLAGQSSAVIADGKLYIMGFEGDGPDLQEGIYCLEAATGKPLWTVKYNDFLSDTVYLRYASSVPCIDAETANVYALGTQGFLSAYSADGKLLWQHSMMEEFGFMTFPNARTGRPVIDNELVIVAGITANWGAHGPPAHRFYAFDKKTGELVWASQPGEQPKDNSFSTPVLGWYQNRRVFWCGGGDGSVYCVNARTGDPIWRYPMSKGGVNATLLPYKDTLIAIHGKENLDTSGIGRMIAVRPGEVQVPAVGTPAVVLKKEAEVWRNHLCGFSSSPALVGSRIYVVDDTADVSCIDADSGKVLWTKDLGVEETLASLLYADGKLYVPILDGTFYVLRPSDAGCEVLSQQKLEGKCCGAPTVLDGRVYVQTTKKLYCFGNKGGGGERPKFQTGIVAQKAKSVDRFLVVPAELLLKPGQSVPMRLIPVDSMGTWIDQLPSNPVKPATKWESYIPPTAKVKSTLKGAVENGLFKADAAAVPSAGAFKATLVREGQPEVAGITRGRIMPDLPITENFDSAALLPKEDDPTIQFAYPPLPWIGARFKWEIREKGGSKCLVKTTDNKLLQRAMTFVGTPEMKNYTVQADVMSDGVIRKIGAKEIVKMSEVGLINQRYIIVLKGAAHQLEVNSNFERIQVNVPFNWLPSVWYTLKTRVDIDAATGAGVVRAKAWKKGEPEPEAWTIEVPHKTAHQSGSPGIFGFSPTEEPVYVDNLSITPNAK